MVDVPLAQDLDLSRWADGVLEVVVEDVTAPSGSQARITLGALVRSRDAPGARFRGPPLAAATLSSAITEPTLLSAPLSLHFAPGAGVARAC